MMVGDDLAQILACQAAQNLPVDAFAETPAQIR
jgi:hypothetical protein